MAISHNKEGKNIVSHLMKTISRVREIDSKNLAVDSWTSPNLDQFLFPRFIEQLASKFPYMAATKKYIERKGEIQFGARAYLPQISYAAQLFHSLSPCHLALHRLSHFGIKPGLVIGKPTVDHSLLSARINMHVQLITGNSDIEVGFNGPLCFTVGPKAQPSVVFMIIPLPDGQGHIYEMANFAPKWNTKNNYLPALSAAMFQFFPIIFRTLFMLGYIEDLPLYNCIDTLDQLVEKLHRVDQRCHEQKATADTMVQSSYFAAHKSLIANGHFTQMMQAAQTIGSQYVMSGLV